MGENSENGAEEYGLKRNPNGTLQKSKSLNPLRIKALCIYGAEGRNRTLKPKCLIRNYITNSLL